MLRRTTLNLQRRASRQQGSSVNAHHTNIGQADRSIDNFAQDIERRMPFQVTNGAKYDKVHGKLTDEQAKYVDTNEDNIKTAHKSQLSYFTGEDLSPVK